MHSYGIAEIVYAVIPNMVYKLLLAYGPTLVEHEIFQNSRLLSRQRQRLSLRVRGAGFCVKGQRSASKNNVALSKLPQRQASYTRLQLGEVKGL